MVIDEALLRAFVDGELDPQSRDKVESAVAHSPDLRKQVAAMRASCLPFRAAFEAQSLPDVPSALRQRVDALLAVADAAPSGARQVPSRRRWLSLGAVAAGSFAMGVLVP